MRRRRLRRNELLGARIIIILLCLVVFIVLIKGIAAFASDSLSGAVRKLSVSMVQSVYLTASADENHLFCYVAQEETGQDMVVSTLAEEIPINYYATHQGKTIIYEDTGDEDEFYEKHFIYADVPEDNNMVEVVEPPELLQRAEQENQAAMNQNDFVEDELKVEYTEGKVEMLPEYLASLENDTPVNLPVSNQITVRDFLLNQYSMEKLNDIGYLMSNYYSVDESTSVTEELFQTEKLINKDLSIQKRDDAPQILIYHTHASETYLDSKEGVEADTVVGPGNYLTELLQSYGYQVYHDKTAYDRLPNGEGNRNYAYSTARPNIEKLLAEYPTIEVIIDLHRDSGAKRVTTINGKDTAQIMLFNGLCRNKTAPVEGLDNPNLESNLAFSLQTALMGRAMYPGFVHKNYLKNYRYNMHLAERYLLIELGTVNNTVMEAYNAMEPLADVLNQVLSNHVE